MQIGCGAFTGCHALEKLTVHMRQGKKSGVKEMLGESVAEDRCKLSL